MDQPGAIQEIADLLEKTGRFDRNYGTALNHAAEIVVDYEATAGRRLDEEMLEQIRSDYGGTPKK
jgi:hypothetical protein